MVLAFASMLWPGARAFHDLSTHSLVTSLLFPTILPDTLCRASRVSLRSHMQLLIADLYI